MSLESRLKSLELRNKETMLEQGAAVSGAAVALSGLSSRLDVLVSSLVSAYSISATDLEVRSLNNNNFDWVLFSCECPYSKGTMLFKTNIPEGFGLKTLRFLFFSSSPFQTQWSRIENYCSNNYPFL